MSLNGLDDVKVKEAHDAAIAELGGWFLLKYVLRDEVDLFERGNGGIVEVRNAIAQYEEESPLFGFLRYRRRNVLIKYVPEGCSRLIQARVTVHFSAFSEKFSPHDTVFPIVSSKDLKDSTLSAACSLHTASGSTSSSTSSLRKRRLVEIAEDENEDKRQSIVLEDQVGAVNGHSMAGTQAQFSTAKSTMQLPDIESIASHHSAGSDAAALSPLEASDNRPASPTKSLDGRRKSSQSTRPAMYSYSSFSSNGRPKVKLGPRPSLDIGGRPQTSASSASYRPVSTLPPGLKLFSKNSKGSKDGAQSHNHNPPPTMTISPPPLQGSDLGHPPSTTLTRPHTSGGRPKTSSGSSVKSAVTPSTTAPKSPMMTPEKMRLMRAMQLRKKQMEASSAQNIPEAPPVPEIRLPQDSPKEAEETYRNSNEMERADSAIAIEAPSEAKMAASDKTIMGSTPASPTETSDEGPSTQPSSVSDSLDETVQEMNNKAGANEADDLKLAQSTVQESRRISPRGDYMDVVEGHKSGGIQNKPTESQTPNVPSKDKQEATVPQEIKNGPEAPEMLPISSAETSPDLEHNGGGVSAKTNPLASELTRIGSENTADASAIPISSLDDSSHLEVGISTIPDEKVQVSVIMQSIEIAETSASPVRQLKIPRSKYSTQPLEENDTKSSTLVQVPSSIGRPSRNNRSISPTGSTCSSETRPSVTDADQHGAERQGRKKRRVIDPIRTDLSTERSGHNSEAELLSDDDLMDELQSATVQEAQPISVSKSPVSPTFTHDTKRFSRAFSNPFASKNKMLSPHDPLPEQSRSVSASYLNRLNQQQTLPIVKKVNLGSGISQRIKALEKATTAPAATPGMTGSTAGSSPSFFMVRQPSRAGSKSPSIVARGESLTRNKDSPLVSREGSPDTIKLRERSESMQSRFEKFDSPPPTQSHKSRPESISVTARIIRDPSQPFPQKPDLGRDPFEYSPLELQQSPLVINHQKAIIAPAPTQKDSLLERRLSNPKKDGKEKRRSSISMVKDLITERRNSIAERRKSMTIEPPTPSTARSSSRPPSTHGNSERTGRPLSISSRMSTSSRDQSTSMSQNVSSPTGSDDYAEKKSGRTSRMFRKMSATLSSSRKSLANAISPTVREEFEPPPFPASQPSQYPSTPSVEVGDVNVQFPDNLLWKRRSMSFDSKGFLILSPAQSNKTMEKSTSTKRYHLSEFRTPFIPEMEVQELPNSVVLDFIDGGGLQVACEDRGGQKRVLQILLEAHRAYGAFGQ